MEDEINGLAKSVSEYPPEDDGEAVEAIMTKFVVISEWVDAEGNRYLTRRAGTGMGEKVPFWDVSGLLFEVLFERFSR